MAVSDIPTPRSQPQILGEMLDAVTSRVGIRRLKVGGPLLSTLEAAARSDVRSSNDTLKALNSKDLDNTEGAALDRLGADEDCPRFLLAKATGTVDITDTSFTKLASKVYQGAAAPIKGSVAVRVEDASLFPSTGTVYIGRNTSNVEGPLTYATKTDNGSYWTLNLSTPTTRFHNKGEEVVVGQGGNRVVGAGQVVGTAQGALSAAVQFATVYDAEIPDGEVEVTDIEVLCTVPGTIGNAPAEAVKEFIGGAPFPGATVLNPKPYVTGRDTETEKDYRARIRAVRNSKQRGTDLAIENAVLGAVAPDENKRVSSASMVRLRGEPSILYVDDGSGYEEVSEGTGIEVVVDSALGGERWFETLYRPVTKAYLESANDAPFALADGMKLSITVGGTTYTHAFDSSEFASIASASAYEVVASINAAPALGFAARTSSSGTRVVIFAREEENEDVVVAAVAAPDVDANAALQLPTSKRWTTLFYRNDRLLSKDGTVAVLRSNSFAFWNAFTGNQTLTVAVDQTAAATYTITDQDFVDANLGFTGVGKNSLEAWAVVLNKKVPGITAEVEGDRLVLTSNRGRTADAALSISGGTMVANFVFATGSSTGSARDYTLDRATGQIVTTTQAAAGDRFSLGTTWTRAFLETGSLPVTNVASPANFWFAVDGAGTMVTHGVGAATPLTASVVATVDHGVKVSILATSAAAAFANVQRGDWAVVWDPGAPAAFKGAWRVIETGLDGGSLLNRIVLEKPASTVPRTGFAAAVLPGGGGVSPVLLIGGYTLDAGAGVLRRLGRGVTGRCDSWNPTTGAYTATASLLTPRARHTATALASGKVLVVGGYDASGNVLASSEVYDPGTGLWTAGPTLAVARAEHTATLLASGNVLIAGGWTGSAATTSCVEYDPTGNVFGTATALNTARFGHSAALLPGGSTEANNVLVAGGMIDATTKTVTVELYNAAAPAWANKASLPTARAYFGIGVPSADKVVAIGDGDPTANGLEGQTTWTRYDVAGDTWAADADISQTADPIHFADATGQCTASASGKVLAFYARKAPAGGAERVIHLRYSDGSDLWATDPGASLFIGSGVQKSEACAVALDGGGTDEVAIFCGSSVNNQSAAGAAVATAHHEVFDATALTWSYPDPLASALVAATLPARGLSFVRTGNDLQVVQIPSSATYTAPTFVTALNDDLDGATAAVYKTSRLRVSTNSYGTPGDLLLVATDASSSLPLPVGEPETNLVGHLASVEAGRGFGTPAGFHVLPVLHAEPTSGDATQYIHLAEPSGAADEPAPATGALVGLRRWSDGLNPTHWESAYTPGSDLRLPEHGNAKAWRGVVGTRELVGGTELLADSVKLGIRRASHFPMAPHQPVVLALPYAVGPRDDLTVVVDGDTETKRFVIPMYRKVQAATATYGSTVSLLDADAASATLPATFGLTYDWNDFAVFMQARVKAHPSSSTKRVLWRFWRHGPEGDYADVRYMYPDAASATLTTRVIYNQNDIAYDLDATRRIGLDIVLGSGAARENAVINATSKLGLARCNITNNVGDVYLFTGFSVASAERAGAGDPTKLTLTVPNNGVIAQGPQGTGIQVGDVMWFDATNPAANTLYSGSFTVTQVDAFNAGTGQQAIWLAGLNDGTAGLAATPNPGTVSFDATGETFFDTATAANDLVRLNSTFAPASYRAFTMRVASFGRQFLRCRSIDHDLAGAQTTPSWHTVVDPDNIAHFVGPSQTAAQVVAAVNALGGEAGAAPLTGTATGDGTGVIDKATWDELNTAAGRYSMTDGVNYVQRTTQPGTIAGHTQFLLRLPVSADLAAGDADWLNEDVRLAPVLPADIAMWFNTPPVSGLWTAAECKTSANGEKVQIASLTPGSAGSVEVQGGTANETTAAVFGSAVVIERGFPAPNSFYVTVRRSEADGLLGGRYVSVDNNFPLPKGAWWDDLTLIQSIDAAGRWVSNVASYVVTAEVNNQRLEVETIGPWVALHLPRGTAAAGLALADAEEHGYVYVTAPTGPEVSDLADVATANRGVFRIVRATENHLGLTIWVENTNAVEQVALAKVKLLSADSAVPGDLWVASSSRFGAANQGSWTITEVGAATVGAELFTDTSWRVDTTERATTALGVATAFGVADRGLFQLVQGKPTRLVKLVATVVPHPGDGTFADVVFDTEPGFLDVGAGPGSVLTALDKLEFPAGVFTGVDGYRHSTGLVGEANRVIYGDPADGATYDGYAASGASILVSGPLVKRVQVALSLRVQSGLASDDLADRVRSAVAAVINQAGVGQPVAVSAIVNAAAAVTGVVAVAVVKPAFSSTNDLVPVGPNEKPLVLDLKNDVLVAFVGE